MLFPNALLLLLGVSGGGGPSPSHHHTPLVDLHPSEQSNWNALYASLNANQNFAFDHVLCGRDESSPWHESPCGCRYEDFSTKVSISCSPSTGLIEHAVLVSALPLAASTTSSSSSTPPVEDVPATPAFPALKSLTVSSTPSAALLDQEATTTTTTTILLPMSFWTSLRLQLPDNAAVRCQHPCLCSSDDDAAVVVHCDLDERTRVKSLTKLDLSNNRVAGSVSFSHLAMPRNNPVTTAATTSGDDSRPRELLLHNNPALTTVDYPPFNCVHVPLCASSRSGGPWHCKFDLPSCQHDSDLGVWWTLYDSLDLQSSQCTRDDPCGTCDASVLRCEGNRIVHLNLEHTSSKPTSARAVRFARLSALRTLHLPAAATATTAATCVDKPPACTSCLPVDRFCQADDNSHTASSSSARQLQAARRTATPNTRHPSLPTEAPTYKPTKSPVVPTSRPSKVPTTSRPTKSPTTPRPTRYPTTRPTKSPTVSRPTRSPTTPRPTRHPTTRPTKSPTVSKPTKSPSHRPTKSPTVSRPTRSPLTREDFLLLPKDNFAADLSAWQELYDALGGQTWFKCRTTRSNPCSCRETEKQVSCRTQYTSNGGEVLRIVAIDLSDNAMEGKITSDMINAFSALELVDFSSRVNSVHPNELTMTESCLKLNLDCDANPTRCMFTRSGATLVCPPPATDSPTVIGPSEDTKTPTTATPTTSAPTTTTVTVRPTTAGTTVRPTMVTVTPTTAGTTVRPTAPTVPVRVPSAAPTEMRVPTYSPEVEYEWPTEEPSPAPAPTVPATAFPTTKLPTVRPTSAAPTVNPSTVAPTVRPSTGRPTTVTTSAPTTMTTPAPSSSPGTLSPGTPYPTTNFPTELPTRQPTVPTRAPVPF